MNFIKKAWRGDERLSVVFWGYWFGFSLAFLFGIILFFHLFEIFTGRDPSLDVVVKVVLALAVFMAVYGVWIVVSVWRCAEDTQWQFLAGVWAVMAFLVHLGPIAFIVFGEWLR